MDEAPVNATPGTTTRDQKIAGFEAQFPEGRFFWDVYRIEPGTKKLTLCDRVHGTEFDEYEFGKKNGPGDYRRALKVNGVNRRGSFTEELFTVGRMAVEPIPEPAAVGVGPGAAGQNVADIIADAVKAALSPVVERLAAIEHRTQAAPAASGTDHLFELVKTLITSQASRQTEGLGLKDILPLVQQRTPMSELVDLMKVMRMMQNFGGGEPASSGPSELGTLAGVVMELLKKPDQAATKPAATPTTPPTVPPATPPAAPATAITEPTADKPAARMPFPGADKLVGGVRELLTAMPAVQLTEDMTLKLANACVDTIETAGGDGADVVERFTPEGLAAAIIEYAPDLASHEPKLLDIARAVHGLYDDTVGEGPADAA